MDPEVLAAQVVDGTACPWLRGYLAQHWRHHRHRSPEDLVMEVATRLLTRNTSRLQADAVTADQVVSTMARQVIADAARALSGLPGSLPDDVGHTITDAVLPTDAVEAALLLWRRAHALLATIIADWGKDASPGAALLLTERLALWRRLDPHVDLGESLGAAVDLTPWSSGLMGLPLGRGSLEGVWLDLSEPGDMRANIPTIGRICAVARLPRNTLDQWLTRARTRVRQHPLAQRHDWSSTHGHWPPLRTEAVHGG